MSGKFMNVKRINNSDAYNDHYYQSVNGLCVCLSG